MPINGPKKAKYTLILAHGAGAGMDTPFMEHLASGIAKHGIRVIRFEFPYMQDRRTTGKKKPPNPMRILEEEWLLQIDAVEGDNIIIGGKSMGGRVATRVLSKSKAIGCVVFGYPFHPPRKPEKLRVAHLHEITKPMLILQGTRDPFGNREEGIASYIPKSGILHWLEDGEHSFKPRKASGRTWEQNLEAAVAKTVAFIFDVVAKNRRSKD